MKLYDSYVSHSVVINQNINLSNVSVSQEEED